MNLQQFPSWGATVKENSEAVPADAERYLTLLIDGVAMNLPEVDRESYLELRTNVARLSRQMPHGLSEGQKLTPNCFD